MNYLVVYYSRSGNSKNIATQISEKLKADVEQIKDFKNRNGFFGFLFSGFEAFSQKLTKIEQIKKNPSDYDIVIICSPVWASSISSPARTYLTNYGKKIKKIAFVAICGYNEGKSFEQMEYLSTRPLATLVINEKEIKTDKFQDKIDNFIKTLN